jgi:arylamine N-acetyltransferase
LATLAAIQLRHTQAIAFENLNPLMGWRPHLPPNVYLAEDHRALLIVASIGL